MSTKELKTKHGNEVRITDEHGWPLMLSFQDDDGRWRHLYLGCSDAQEIATILNAFVTIHS